MPNKMTVLLDAGGVLIDESDIEKYYTDLISSLISERIKGYESDSYYTDLAEAVDSYCHNVYQFIIWKNCSPDIGLFDELWERVLEDKEINRPALKLSEGIGEELAQLKENFNIGIAGQYGKEIIDLLKNKNILGYVDYPLTQDEFEITKPDPRFYEAILNRIGVKAEDAIMVGDRIDKDIAPAGYLGMKTVRIKTGIHINQKPRIPEEIPDLELNGIGGLAEAVRKRFAR